ncbi:MAG: ABC transporter substrate-binding protein [Rhodospirillales bacterium]|nr:ABC transporter substrate-binding protein [Rhodospirillales bacterium]
MIKTALRTLAVCVLSMAVAVIAAAAPAGPTATIDALHHALLETMKQGGKLDARARYERLSPIVGATYDFERMVAIIAGPVWGRSDGAEQQAAVEAFRRYSVANYASRFKEYTGEQFEILGERPGVRDLIVVETKLVRSDGPPVSINYIFEQRDGDWQVIDVLAERAISELALRRSEFAQTLKDGGLGGLTAILNVKADEMLAK